MQISRIHTIPFAKRVKLNSCSLKKKKYPIPRGKQTAQAETHSSRCHLEAAESEEPAS